MAASLAATSAHTPDNARLSAWLRAAGGGDANAYRQLAQALGPRLHALATRLLSGDHAAAQDVVQEVLIKLWQQAPRWQGEEAGVSGNVSAYASRLVYTTAMDQHRKKGPVSVASDFLSGQDDDGQLGATVLEQAIPAEGENTVMRRQQRNWLLGALRQLPERQQEAVVLSYFHEYNQKDVARALGTTEKAVESLLVRARRSLAVMLPGQAGANQHALNQGGYLQ